MIAVHFGSVGHVPRGLLEPLQGMDAVMVQYKCEVLNLGLHNDTFGLLELCSRLFKLLKSLV